eukprot:gene3336-4182_t
MKIFILSLLFLLFISNVYAVKRYYVDSKSTCTKSCGTSNAAFKTLEEAISITNSFSCNDWDYDIPEVYLKIGTYSGVKNKALYIRNPINLRPWNGNSSNIIIDCQGSGFGFNVNKATQFYLNGVTIRNCNSNYGGGISIINTPSTLSDVRIYNNSASIGGGLYTKSKTVTIMNSFIENNDALEDGGGIFMDGTTLNILNTKLSCNSLKKGASSSDISCNQGSSSVDVKSNLTNTEISCVQCKITLNKQNICGTRANRTKCISSGNPGGGNPEPPKTCPAPVFKCGDGICDFNSESCLSCPQDCPSCTFSGLKLESYKNCHPLNLTKSCLVSTIPIEYPVVTDFMDEECPVAGIMKGYFSVDRDGIYRFKMISSNLGVKMTINNRTYINAYFQQPSINSEAEVLLKSKSINHFKVEFFSGTPGVKNISVFWKPTDLSPYVIFDSLFYSQNVCGDRILDTTFNETCIEDEVATRVIVKNNTCGDGICQEDVNSCVQDCAFQITKVCPPTTRVEKHLPSGYFVGSDTLGTLINNQMIWHLPGIEKLTFGMNVITGEATLSPLFYFGYCNSKASNIIQDVYRGLIYDLPDEVNAEPYPRCSYQVTTDSFSSSFSMAESYAEKHSFEVGAKISVGKGGWGGSANAAFSQEVSVKNAREIETKRSGSISKSEVSCLTSKIEIIKNTFHPNFLKDIGGVGDVNDMVEILKKYGTYYFRTVTMGGRLTQITSMDYSFESDKTSSEIEESQKISFGMSIKAPMFSASGDFSESKDSQVTSEQQKTYENSTSRSSIITYGGAVGSFNPGDDSAPAEYTQWARSVDLLPVPLDYKLSPILSIIPETWKNIHQNVSIKKLWQDADDLLSQMYEGFSIKTKYSLELYFEPEGRFLEDLANTMVSIDIDEKNVVSNEMKAMNRTIDRDSRKVYSDWKWFKCETVDTGNHGGEEDFCYTRLKSPMQQIFYRPQMEKTPKISLRLDYETNGYTRLHKVAQTRAVILFNHYSSKMYYFQPNAHESQEKQILTEVFFKDYYLLYFKSKCITEGLRGQRNEDGEIVYGEYEKLEIILTGQRGSIQHVLLMTEEIFPDISNMEKDVFIRIPKTKSIGRVNYIRLQNGNTREWGPWSNPSQELRNMWLGQTYCGFYNDCTPTTTSEPWNMVVSPQKDLKITLGRKIEQPTQRLYSLRDLK